MPLNVTFSPISVDNGLNKDAKPAPRKGGRALLKK
jgi:hypothetical protein